MTNTNLISSFAELPATVAYVWHGANDPVNLARFLASPVEWGELDVNLDPRDARLILRHDGFGERPPLPGEELVDFTDALTRALAAGKAIKLDIKAGRGWIDPILAVVDASGIDQERLWFNADYPLFGDEWIVRLRQRYPRAVLQVPLHSLPGWPCAPTGLRTDVVRLAALGINRWSVGWRYPEPAGYVAQLRVWGHVANLYGVADLAEFLDAVALAPVSVTADFNFPAWAMDGRGSGHGGVYHGVND